MAINQSISGKSTKDMSLSKTITFSRSAEADVLSAFDKSVDKDGFIVESKNPMKRVLSPDGEPVKAQRLGAIKRGSLLFFKSDLPSLIELSDRLK